MVTNGLKLLRIGLIDVQTGEITQQRSWMILLSEGWS